MLNRLFQAAVITFLLSLIVGGNSIQSTRTVASKDDSVKVAANLTKQIKHPLQHIVKKHRNSVSVPIY
jgi:hypothetical protein